MPRKNSEIRFKRNVGMVTTVAGLLLLIWGSYLLIFLSKNQSIVFGGLTLSTKALASTLLILGGLYTIVGVVLWVLKKR